MDEYVHESLGPASVILNCNKLALDSLERFKYDDAVHLLHRANLLVATVHDIKLKAMTLNNLGCVYKHLQQPLKALSFLTDAINCQETSADALTKAGTHLNVCALKSLIHDHRGALHHATTALHLLQDRDQLTPGAAEAQVIAFNNAAVEYEHLGLRKAAAEAYYEGWECGVESLGKHHQLTVGMLEAYESVSVPSIKRRRNVHSKTPVPTLLPIVTKDGRDTLHRKLGSQKKETYRSVHSQTKVKKTFRVEQRIDMFVGPAHTIKTHTVKALNVTALAIAQRAVKRFLCQQFVAQARACTLVQCSYKASLCRERASTIRRLTCFVQAAFRRVLAREAVAEFKQALLTTRKAQKRRAGAFVRLWMRALFCQQKKRRKVALQQESKKRLRRFRGHKTSQLYSFPDFSVLIQIQSVFRRFLCTSYCKQLAYTMTRSALKIQSVYVSYRLQKKTMILQTSTRIIQSWLRHCYAVMLVHTLKVEDTACSQLVLVIQQGLRRLLAVRGVDELRWAAIARTAQQLKLYEVCTFLQSTVRTVLAKQKLHKLRVLKQVRQYLRSFCVKYQVRMKLNCTRIQKSFRKFIAKRTHTELRSVVRIQSCFRWYLVHYRVTSLHQFQSQVRRAASRVRQRILTEHLAARRIQDAFRTYNERKYFLAVRSAATLIGKTMKMAYARRVFTDIRQAILLIQTQYRKHRKVWRV